MFESPSSNAQLKAMFNASILNDGDMFYYLADKMAESVQYGFQDALCLPLIKLGNQSVDRLLSQFASYVVEFAGPELGGPIGYSSNATLNTTVALEANWRQWWWQTCAELAYFQNAPPPGVAIRSQQINMTYHLQHCQLFFGGVWPDTNATNNYYGGNDTAMDTKGPGNIIFMQGSQDPWQQAGVQWSTNEAEPQLFITCHNCGHCVDIVGCPNGCADGNQSLNTGRARILEQVVQWLQEAS